MMNTPTENKSLFSGLLKRVSSTYSMTMTKDSQTYSKNAKRTATTKHYDWALLNNKDIRDKYVLELHFYCISPTKSLFS